MIEKTSIVSENPLKKIYFNKMSDEKIEQK